MPLNISYYGKTKPGAGVKPLRVQTNVKLPFGKKHPVNWWNGKHIPLRKSEEGGGSVTSVAYDLETHELYYTTANAERVVIDTAVPESRVVEE